MFCFFVGLYNRKLLNYDNNVTRKKDWMTSKEPIIDLVVDAVFRTLYSTKYSTVAFIDRLKKKN
jgi:hypothetical protein